MRQILIMCVGILSVALLSASSGCYKNSGKESGNNGHDDHPEKGPHNGALIELGKDHKYHAELVHDEKTHKVTVYILGEVKDGKVEDPVAIDEKEVVINVKHDGKAEQFKLKADPDKDDPEGKSSRFVSEDKDLSHDLDHEGTHAELRVVIGGTTYRGHIEHHDHGDEGEDHKGHKDHDDDDKKK